MFSNILYEPDIEILLHSTAFCWPSECIFLNVKKNNNKDF